FGCPSLATRTRFTIEPELVVAAAACRFCLIEPGEFASAKAAREHVRRGSFCRPTCPDHALESRRAAIDRHQRLQRVAAPVHSQPDLYAGPTWPTPLRRKLSGRPCDAYGRTVAPPVADLQPQRRKYRRRPARDPGRRT